MAKHHPLFCAACRVMVLVPEVRGPFGGISYVVPGDPWVKAHSRDGYPIWFCSAECHEKGEAKPVREPVNAHVDWERGAKVNLVRQRGRDDALMGFDCVGHRPEYVKGHGEGMAMRAVIEAAKEKLAEERKP